MEERCAARDPLRTRDERIGLVSANGLAAQTGWLVEHEDMLVLVRDGDLHLRRSFIAYEGHDASAHGDRPIMHRALAIELDRAAT